MKNKKQKFTAKDILQSYRDISIVEWVGTIDKNKISFDNDKGDNDKGENDGGPYLELTCYKDFVKFTKGDLTAEERNTYFPYDDFENVHEFTDYLAEFITKYFKSFKMVRVKY